MHIDPSWFAPGASVTLLAGKIFLNFARSMPPPPAQCNFWCRWGFDFIQAMADNQDRSGAIRSIAVVNTQKDSTVTKSEHSSTEAQPDKQSERVPDGVDR